MAEYKLSYTAEDIDQKLGKVDKLGGTVEITSGAPTKENTVMTFDPTAEEVNMYTAPEVDELLETKMNKSFSFQDRGRLDNKNIDDLRGIANQGQYWAEVSKTQGTQPWDNGYYFLFVFPDMQVAFKYNKCKMKARLYTNNQWYDWSEYYTASEVAEHYVSTVGATVIISPGEEICSFTVPAGTYLVGMYLHASKPLWLNGQIDVDAPDYATATCTKILTFTSEKRLRLRYLGDAENEVYGATQLWAKRIC